VQTAVELACYLNSSETKPAIQLLNQVKQVIHNLNVYIPGELIRNMLFAATKQNIPYFILDYQASFVSYGQGSCSVLYNHGSSEFDSNIGFNLQKNKSMTNTFLKNLGYPTTEQRLATSREACVKITQQIGFPVVIKPLASGQGKGVTSNIQNMQQLENAFSQAMRYSENNVIIEKHVAGDDHRITVSQGQVIGISKKQPANIIGDGIHTIQALIDIAINNSSQPGLINNDRQC